MFWNPLVDDGDAMRLAIKMSLPVSVFRVQPGLRDPHAAVRLAIVRAVAAQVKSDAYTHL